MAINSGDEYDNSVRRVIVSTVKSIYDTFDEGARRGKTDFYDMNDNNHIRRAISHLEKYLDNDKSEDHLCHALWRTAVVIDRRVCNIEGSMACPDCGYVMVDVDKNEDEKYRKECLNCGFVCTQALINEEHLATGDSYEIEIL